MVNFQEFAERIQSMTDEQLSQQRKNVAAMIEAAGASASGLYMSRQMRDKQTDLLEALMMRNIILNELDERREAAGK